MKCGLILFRFVCLFGLVLVVMGCGAGIYQLMKITIAPFVADPFDQAFVAIVLTNALIGAGLLLYLKEIRS
jgi:type IV secretory pathway TrbF-like protein